MYMRREKIMELLQMWALVDAAWAEDAQSPPETDSGEEFL